MDGSDKSFWHSQIEASKDAMDERHQTWKRLLDSYELKIELPGLDEEKTIRLSRMYPIMRQILASVAFNYPHINVMAEPLYERLGIDWNAVSRVLEKSANSALKLMQAKVEVHQQIFDTAFCGVGWGKFGWNPVGADSFPPYVSNDVMRDGFTYYMRKDPFRIFVDPDTPPQSIGYAYYVIEEIEVPWKYVRDDPRYTLPEGFDGPEDLGYGAESERLGSDLYETSEEDEIVRRVKSDKKTIKLYEIHNRMDGRLHTFLEHLEDPIEDVPHPFGNANPRIIGDQVVDYEPLPGSLLKNGTQYMPLRFDLNASFHPVPPMEYIEDLQALIVESVSRRADILKRFARIIFAEESELGSNSQLEKRLKEAEDGDIVAVKSLQSIKAAEWGTVPIDQLNLEGDARGYEEQSLHVGDLAQQGASRKTATESALLAGQSSLNREWMQQAVAELYEDMTTNNFRVWRDYRYTPHEFIVNIADADAESEYIILTTADFNYEFALRVDAQSMQPMIEEVEQQNSILLYDRLIGNPLVDQVEATKMLLRGFRRASPEKLLKGMAGGDTTALIDLEIGFLLQGQMPPVVSGMDHIAHREAENPQAVAQDPRFAQLPPQQQQLVLQVAQQHAEMHQQMVAQPTAVGSQPSVDGRLVEGGQGGIISEVRQNAQETADAATADVATLTGRGA